MKKSKKIKCDLCGKFIAYKDIPNNVKYTFTPDSEFTIETHEFIHKKCLK